MIHVCLHGAREEGFGAPPVEAFVRTPSASWLHYGIDFETELTELQLCCGVPTPLVQDLAYATADPFSTSIASWVVGTAKHVLE